MKTLLTSSTLAALLAAAPVFADQPDIPGQKGFETVIGTAGFGTALNANGKGLTGQAATVYGNNGAGNGGDADTVDGVGLDDHDPNNFGGAPDPTR